MPKRPDGFIRAFCMSGLQIASGVQAVERRFGIDLGLGASRRAETKTADYEQFEGDLRAEASRMAQNYEVFYCLENSIRKLVNSVLTEECGPDWFDSEKIDENRIRKECHLRRKKEVDAGITPRSEKMIDYTTFGELSQIITDNWNLFEPIFYSKIAVSNISNQLNVLRGPIAHCCATSDIEEERLALAVRTWFRMMS